MRLDGPFTSGHNAHIRLLWLVSGALVLTLALFASPIADSRADSIGEAEASSVLTGSAGVPRLPVPFGAEASHVEPQPEAWEPGRARDARAPREYVERGTGEDARGPSGNGLAPSAANRAALVVDMGDGSVVTRCVEFSEPQITGYDVLTRSGLSLVVSQSSGTGLAVCKIGDIGCSADNCFCSMPNYWSYWHLTNGNWVYSQMGAPGYTVRPGDVEGWRWGSGSAPSNYSFDQVCQAPPTATPTATDTPVPPTATPAPTDTPLPPTDTPAPTSTTVRPTRTPRPTEPPAPPTNTPRPTNTPQPAPTDTPLPTSTTAPTDTPAPQSTQAPATNTPMSSQPAASPTLAADEPISSDVTLTETSTPEVVSEPAPLIDDPSPSASPTATSLPTRTPSPSPSPAQKRAKAGVVATSAVATPSPSATPASSPSPTQGLPQKAGNAAETSPSDAQPSSPFSVGHYVFGLVVVGLAGSLAFGKLRRR